jgi:hypothetical protein
MVTAFKREFANPVDLEKVRWIVSSAAFSAFPTDNWSAASISAFIDSQLTDAAIDFEGDSQDVLLERLNSISDDLWSRFSAPAIAKREASASRDFLETISCITWCNLTRVADSEEVLARIRDIQGKLPVMDDISSPGDDAEAGTQVFTDALIDVLGREADALRSKGQFVADSILEIEACLVGTQLATDAIQSDIDALARRNIPAKWGGESVSVWLDEFTKRVDFFNLWVRRGKPSSFCLGAFSEPHAFLQAVLLKYAKDSAVDVSQLFFEVGVLDVEPTAGPQIGVYVHGIVSWGMKWDRQLKQFVEAKDSTRYEVPWLHLKPTLALAEMPENGFRCPVFVGNREKVLFEAIVATAEPAEFWQLQGAALYVNTSI